MCESHIAHVIPALMAKFKDAKDDGLKQVELLGDGMPVREFLHVEDLASAVSRVTQSELYRGGILDVAGAESVTIKELAHLIKELERVCRYSS